MKRTNEANTTTETHNTKSQGCCGGAPLSNKDACCVKDEEAKAAGAEGCGCASAAADAKDAAAVPAVPVPAVPVPASKGCCP